LVCGECDTGYYYDGKHGTCKKPTTEDNRKIIYMNCPAATAAAQNANTRTGFEECSICAMKEGDTMHDAWCERCKTGFMSMMGECFGQQEGTDCLNNDMLKNCQECRKFSSHRHQGSTDHRCMKCKEGFF
jgi:hypothetical protein